MNYVLHYAPDNASLIIRLVLEELGRPYETRLVDRAKRAQEGAAYRAINPAGTIPALETPEGVLSETGAILLYLADRHGGLAPAPDAPGRGAFLKWLFFLSNTVQAGLRLAFYPEKYLGSDENAHAALRTHFLEPNPVHITLPMALRLLDAELAARGTACFHGETPGILDYYTACLLRWVKLYTGAAGPHMDIASYPALKIMAQVAEQRPATQAAQLAEGLGPTPFSAPRRATPPEGSAL